ncbi:2Fe-2S iron-sulfur cluster-binding protein [Methylonatrum kenyense]|uniref:2Fe-2S iron-sulfur cluster-binding protein n=1 Tax=Methylonatrum kenyense TaxID=455253 RepID=UPI0020C0ABBC|nr:2Fe-2S iron-sulfur cluster-binding protein [Methylonatrum kenyense]MCK8517351.1 2Fe-2S iron-sulfur cluster-binding protein [Methylonatrum kenyense]
MTDVPARLPARSGEWIDRDRVVEFRFEGQVYRGYAGDTVTSALVAAGRRTLGRSFKYHRQRGVLSLANHDVNVMVDDGQRTNLRADVLPISAGLELQAVNTKGGLTGDRHRHINRMAKLLPVGFYYKTFHRPRRLFPFWERRIRALAGLGTIKRDAPRVETPKRYDFCDVLVIGAGPTGLSAALAAANNGAQVVIADENARAGGSLTHQWAGDAEAVEIRERLLSAVDAHENIDLRTGTTAAGYYADNWVALVDDIRLSKMRAGQVIVASGCFEQPAVFHGNDLPGVMLGSGAQRLLHRYAVRPFQRAVILAANSDAYRLALDLVAAGIEVATIADLRTEGETGPLAERVTAEGVVVRRGCGVYEAHADKNGELSGVVVAPVTAEGEFDLGRQESISCDGLLMSVGWTPAANLLYQAGTKMDYADAVQQFVPAELPDNVHAAGRVNGVHDLRQQLADGERAGLAASLALGLYSGEVPEQPRHEGGSPNHPYPIFDHPKGKNFVDFDEDLQLKDLLNACQEGFDNIELMKRYSTVGMGPSQGKHSNMNAVRILARHRGQSIMATGTTTARPYFHPVPLKLLAGRSFNPERRTSLHEWHRAADARFVHVGDWLRPEVYGAADTNRPLNELVLKEVTAVRRAVGLIDVGTLGKLDIRGPDAAEFLERIYTGRFSNVKHGRMTLALRCDESGVVTDDGIAARFAGDHFYVTASTTRSGAVLQDMQHWLMRWGLDATVVNATGHFAAMNLAGPYSRHVLAELTSADISDDSLPFGGVATATVAGVPARLMRVGFVGELGFEIHVPAQFGPAVWERVMAAGKQFDICPFGVEAQRILRLEKGIPIVGQDSDGLTNPFEMDMGWALAMSKPFFIGQRSLQILQRRGAERVLAGFSLPRDGNAAQVRESHLVIRDGEIVGRVTSVAYSPTLDRIIGLAYVAPAQNLPESTVKIRADGGVLRSATVERLPFYDPDDLAQAGVASLQEVS